MKTNFLLLGAVALLASCSNSPKESPYTVNMTLNDDVAGQVEGKTAYIINFDSGEKIDSAIVKDGKLAFAGEVESPLAARVMMEGLRGPHFILEGGDIVIDADDTASGTALNVESAKIEQKVEQLIEQYQNAAQDTTEAGVVAAAAVEKAYNAFTDSVMKANLDNPIGYMFLIDKSYELDKAQLEALIKEYPQIGSYQRIGKLLKSMQAKEQTSVGHKYIDFEIKNDSTSQKLSDYVGKTPLTLVDFWASWCGPCIRETQTLKELLSEYGNKGLSVVGVAVWDKPEDTIEAIKTHELPWPVILNSQNVATDLYGIPAIPCIILIDAEGNILSRDKQGDELRADVRQAVEALQNK